MLALVVVMMLLLGWTLVAGRLARYNITAPLALLIAGVVLTAGHDPVFVLDVPLDSAEPIVEVVLAILLFTDATEIPGGVLGREPRLTLRLLLVALPLSLLLAWLVGTVLFGDVSPWLITVLAAVVVPPDLGPAGALLRDRRIPERLRQALKAESGLNDGLVAPVFLFSLAGATAAGDGELRGAVVGAVPSVAVAIGIGAIVGWSAGRVLHRSLRASWTQASALRLGVLTLPLLAFAGSVVLGGNGFVAAFVAGVFFEPEARRLPPHALHLVEDVGTLLSLALWFVFGAIVNDTVGAGSITWQILLFTALAVTVVRMLPVVVSLAGTDVSARDRVFLGWVGPRGIATLVFGLLASVQLDERDGDVALTVMVLTVVASIVVHGLTTGPVAGRYAARRSAARPRPRRAGRVKGEGEHPGGIEDEQERR